MGKSWTLYFRPVDPTSCLYSPGNGFFQANKPWLLLKSDPEECATIMAAAAGLVLILAILFDPYMPNVARKVCTHSPIDLPAFSGFEVLELEGVGFELQ